MSELKPCPFCGEESQLKRDPGNEVYNQSWFVACTKCWCSGASFYGSNAWAAVKKEDKSAEAQAILEWNTRAELPDDIRADVLALCDAANDYGVRMMLGGDMCKVLDRISERLRGSDANTTKSSATVGSYMQE